MLIIRDIIFGGKRHYRELLTKSMEGIASNILADRLKTLVAQGVLTKADDPTHKQKAIYSLTEQGIQLVPVLAQMSAWGRKFMPVSRELAIRARLLEEGGPPLWTQFMDELRVEHLGEAAGPAEAARTVGPQQNCRRPSRRLPRHPQRGGKDDLAVVVVDVQDVAVRVLEPRGLEGAEYVGIAVLLPARHVIVFEWHALLLQVWLRSGRSRCRRPKWRRSPCWCGRIRSDRRR